MKISEVVTKWPKTMEVMLKYGLHCVGCHLSPFETIEQGALVHGLTQEELDNMLKEMNELVKE